MIAKLVKLAAAMAIIGMAAPAWAAPACGTSAAIARLDRAWTDANGAIMIAAHRGGHLKAPENSLAAIDEAVAAGADFVEIDVRVSSDGVPFVMHDRTVDRTTNGSGAGETMTFGELRRLRLKGGDTPPPTLLEMLRHSCGRVLVDLDMKTDRVAPVVAVIQGLDMIDQVGMFDADSDTLRQARALEPRLRVMTRLRGGAALAAINEGLAPIRIVHGDPESLTPAMRDAIRALPARIWANALGDADGMVARGEPGACAALKALRDKGVSVFQTDYPARLRARLAQCGLGRDRRP